MTRQENCSTGIDYFTPWKNSLNLKDLIEPHLGYEKLLNKFCADKEDGQLWKDNLVFSVFDLINGIKPGLTIPVHYSGAEDKKYHDQEILDDCQLQKWLNSQEYKQELATKFQISVPGEIFLL